MKTRRDALHSFNKSNQTVSLTSGTKYNHLWPLAAGDKEELLQRVGVPSLSSYNINTASVNSGTPQILSISLFTGLLEQNKSFVGLHLDQNMMD